MGRGQFGLAQSEEGVALIPVGVRRSDGWHIIRPVGQFWLNEAPWQYIDPWGGPKQCPKMETFLEDNLATPLLLFEESNSKLIADLADYPTQGRNYICLLGPNSSLVGEPDVEWFEYVAVANFPENRGFRVRLSAGEEFVVECRGEQHRVTPIPPLTIMSKCHTASVSPAIAIGQSISIGWDLNAPVWRAQLFESMDATGQVIAEKIVPRSENAEFWLHGLPAGRYLIRGSTEEHEDLQKVEFIWSPRIGEVRFQGGQRLPKLGVHEIPKLTVLDTSGLILRAFDFKEYSAFPSSFNLEERENSTRVDFIDPRVSWYFARRNSQDSRNQNDSELGAELVEQGFGLFLQLPADLAVEDLEIRFNRKRIVNPKAGGGENLYWYSPQFLARLSATLMEGVRGQLSIHVIGEGGNFVRLVGAPRASKVEINSGAGAPEDLTQLFHSSPRALARPAKSPDANRAEFNPPVVAPDLDKETYLPPIVGFNSIRVVTTWSAEMVNLGEELFIPEEQTGPTSEAEIILDFAAPGKFECSLDVGGSDKGKYRRVGTEPIRLKVRNLMPTRESSSGLGGVMVTLKSGDESRVLCFYPSKGLELKRIKTSIGRSFRPIRALEHAENNYVAHIARVGSNYSKKASDLVLAELFSEVEQLVSAIVNSREPSQNSEVERENRQVLVCLFRLFEKLHIPRGAAPPGRELKRWIDASRRHKRDLEELYHEIEAAYESRLGGE